MPYKIEWEEKGVYSKLWGSCSVGDVIGILQSIESDPRFTAIRYNIVDYLNVTDAHASEADVPEINALNYAQSLSNSRLIRAIVATDHKLIELVKIWMRESTSPEKLGLFATVDEARAWVKAILAR